MLSSAQAGATSRTGPPTPNRQGPKTLRSTFTSNFASGADNHGPVVGGGKHVAVAGAVALLCVRQGYGHLGLGLGLGPRATHQVPLQQLGAGQDDPVVGERDSQPGRERSGSLKSQPEGGAAPAEVGRSGGKGESGRVGGPGCKGLQRLGAPILGSRREACRGTPGGKGFCRRNLRLDPGGPHRQ